MASADSLKIDIQGRQTHGSSPWRGVDPVVTAAQIILALQTIPSRQLDATLTPSVLTISTVHGGVRANIIPDTLEMQGTIRTHDEAVRADIKRRIEKTATAIAESQGAKADRLDPGRRAGDLQRSAAHRLGHQEPRPRRRRGAGRRNRGR